MQAIAPNLTVLVGELVGARLISHAGSLTNLAKSAASTIQILGAEKALFRALKTKHDTPKYGIIYHASLIGQASGKNKGKIARVLAAKAALGLRVDALEDWSGKSGEGPEPTEEERTSHGTRSKLLVERRLRALEGRPINLKGAAVAPSGSLVVNRGKWEIKEARKYNANADGLIGDEPAANTKVPEVVSATAAAEEDSEESSDEDEEMEDASPVTNGHSKSSGGKDHEAQRKAEKAARKAARKLKREAKAAKRAAKEAKSATKKAKKSGKPLVEEVGDDEGAKKRKRDDGEEKSAKKKKKQSKA
jgi:nucleolar protein 58